MKKLFYALSLGIALFLTIGVTYDIGDSFCVLFPQNGRDIWGVAQRNILVYDEGRMLIQHGDGSGQWTPPQRQIMACLR